MQVDTRPDTMSNIASCYGVDSQKLQRHYKHEVSGFKQWAQLPHAEEYLIYPENITDKLSIDEVSLSKEELYTFITNKNTGTRNKKCVVAVINGTEAKTIQEVLDKISLQSKLQSLDGSAAGRTTTWRVDYGFGATPSSFTSVTTFSECTTSVIT